MITEMGTNKMSEKEQKCYDKIADEIVNIVETLVIPKTAPQTPEECEQLRHDPRIEMKIEEVKSLLMYLGLEQASEDVELSNVKRYALWVLHRARMDVKLTNPYTREVFIDERAKRFYEQVRKFLKGLDLLPQIHPLLEDVTL